MKTFILANNFLDLSKDILCSPSVGPDLPARMAGEAPYFDYNNCDIELAVGQGAIDIV